MSLFVLKSILCGLNCWIETFYEDHQDLWLPLLPLLSIISFPILPSSCVLCNSLLTIHYPSPFSSQIILGNTIYVILPCSFFSFPSFSFSSLFMLTDPFCLISALLTSSFILVACFHISRPFLSFPSQWT